MYLDPFSTPAYQLQCILYMLVLRISQMRTVLLNVDCVQCVFPPAKAQSQTALCTFIIKLRSFSAWPSILHLLTYRESNVTACTANLDLSMNTSVFTFYYFIYF